MRRRNPRDAKRRLSPARQVTHDWYSFLRPHSHPCRIGCLGRRWGCQQKPVPVGDTAYVIGVRRCRLALAQRRRDRALQLFDMLRGYAADQPEVLDLPRLQLRFQPRLGPEHVDRQHAPHHRMELPRVELGASAWRHHRHRGGHSAHPHQVRCCLNAIAAASHRICPVSEFFLLNRNYSAGINMTANRYPAFFIAVYPPHHHVSAIHSGKIRIRWHRLGP
jgi:hypothetical protein